MTFADTIKEMHAAFCKAMEIARNLHPDYTEEQIYQCATAELNRQLGL